jgi:hypothetical protein
MSLVAFRPFPVFGFRLRFSEPTWSSSCMLPPITTSRRSSFLPSLTLPLLPASMEAHLTFPLYRRSQGYHLRRRRSDPPRSTTFLAKGNVLMPSRLRRAWRICRRRCPPRGLRGVWYRRRKRFLPLFSTLCVLLSCPFLSRPSPSPLCSSILISSFRSPSLVSSFPFSSAQGPTLPTS